MLEINKHTLKDAIARLPRHTPPDSNWDSLERQLDKAAEQDKLEQTIEELPQHSPPDLIWDKIEAGLESDASQSAKVIRMAKFRKVAVAASTIGLLLVAMLFTLQRQSSNGQEHIAYSTELVTEQILAHDWNDDEDAFTYVKELCTMQAPVCKLPGFLDLNKELEELNSAKVELQDVISQFETSADLIMQLAKIERNRSDILKQMLAMI